MLHIDFYIYTYVYKQICLHVCVRARTLACVCAVWCLCARTIYHRTNGPSD